MKGQRRKFRIALLFAFLFAVLAFVSVGCASGTTPPEEEWNMTFGGTDHDTTKSVQQATDGGYILAGGTHSYGAGLSDIWLVKTDSNGNEQWKQTFGGTGWDEAWSVQQTSDGGYILAGRTDSYGAGSYDFWLVKTDSNGNELWNMTFGGTGDDSAYSVQQTSDGGYILAGRTDSYGAGSYDFWLVKTDSNGNELWNQTLGGTSGDSAYSVQQTTGGGYILVGRTTSYGAGREDFWLVKTDSDGNELWNQTLGGTGYDIAYSVQQTADGGYILAGSTKSYGAGREDFWLVKTDSDGNELWNQTLGGTGYDIAYSVQQTTGGGYILAGRTGSYGAGQSDFWLLKIYSNGIELWNRTFGGIDEDYAYSVQQTADGGYIIAGSTRSYGAGSSDCWLIKVGGEPAPILTPTATPTGTPALTPMVTPTPTPPTVTASPTPIVTPTLAPTPTPGEGVLGFETVLAIAGLLAVAYLLRRRE